MDPYFNSRGPRPGSFSQSSYSFMSNLFEQNTFSDEPFRHLSQGPRLNFQISDSTVYDQGMTNERTAGIYAGNQTSDQFRYNSYVSSSLPSMNPAHTGNSDNYSSVNDPNRFVRDLNRDRLQSNTLNITNTSGIVENDLAASISTEITYKENDSKYNQETNKAYDFSRKDTFISHGITNVETKDMAIANDSVICKRVVDIPDTITASDNNLENEVEMDENALTAVALNTANQNDSVEKAVDLSKTSVSTEKYEESNVGYTTTTAIKQEQCDENETAENEADYDSDKTIDNEPVKKSEKIFKCKECDKVYRCETSLKKHQNIHSGLFRCKLCNKSWSSKYALSQHERVHSGDREGNLCTTCGKTFFDSSSLNKHIRSVHAGIKTFACDRCDLSFYARKTLDEHIRVHTGERPFKCKMCPKTYKRISDLNHHIRGHTGETKHVCEVCGKGLRRLSELKVHMNQHRDDMIRVKKSDIVCSWCGLAFKNHKDLTIHTKEHIENVEKGDIDGDEQDSASAAAAVDSILPDERNNIIQKSAPERTRMQSEEAKKEMTSIHHQMHNLYQQAGVKPSRSYNYVFDSHMPMSDASFHAYFPLPEDKETYLAQTEPGEIRRKESKQDGSVHRVDNWLNKNFAAATDASHKNIISDNIQPIQESLVGTESNKLNNDHSDTTAPGQDNNKANDLNNSNVNSSDTNFDMSATKTSISGEKQKSIATVIDKLAEIKAKDMICSESKESDDIEIKCEHMDDGGETDDYEIGSLETCEPEKICIKISKKLLKKGKSIKKQTRKQNLKVKSKPKHSEAKTRKRKQTPKKLKESKQKSNKSNNENSDKLQDTGSIKSERESETDDFPPMYEHVIIDGMHICSECDKKFKSRSAFKKHQEMHFGLYTCSQCKKSLSSGWSLRQHMQIHNSADDRPRFPCNVCTKSFCDKSSLHKHVKSVHMAFKPFKCTECERAFSERKTLAEHMRTHTGERPFLCTFCAKTFKRVSELNHHIRGHTGETKHTCDTCGRGFRRLSELLRHATLHTEEKPFHCNICGKEFRSFSVMREHTLRHLGGSKYDCERCGRKYFKRSHLERHLRSDKECTKCKYCLVPMEDPSEREKHEATHTGELKYLCTVCDKQFRGRGPLNKHLRIHSQDRSYVCDQCGASFIQSNHLRQHIRTHTGEKPYSCLMCGKAFAQSGTLYSHMKTHLTEPLPLQTAGGYQYYDSEDSENNEIEDLEAFKTAVNMIETKVA